MNRRIRALGNKYVLLLIGIFMWAVFLFGCGKKTDEEAEDIGNGQEAQIQEAQEVSGGGGVGIAGESAKDASVDMKALQEENPDIFAWLYIPDTDIDAPVLQSAEADDYYENHNAYREDDDGGALYTELANLKNMCDFNTVIHGKTLSDSEEGTFADLYRFADPDFFAEHGDVYFYLDGNLLTYTVFAAYERENTSLIRSYDFTYGTGCQQFLEDVYSTREMGKNLREGWEEITPYHFLLTLTTQKESDPDKQFVVIALLVGDAAGEIDRMVEW